MNRTRAEPLADVPALLTATEQHLLAGRELCERLAVACSQPASAEVVPFYAAGSVAPDTSSQPDARADARSDELAARVRAAAARLVCEADALAAALTANGRVEFAAGRELRAAEAERARLARDLHDGPAQYFANAVLETEYLQKLLPRDPPAVAEGLARLRRTMQEGVKEIRHCLFDLRLPAVEDVGLVALLDGFLSEYERHYGVMVEATLPDDEPGLSAEQTIAVFRILQEALTNARKHSGAERVRVRVRCRPHEMTVLVEDDGCGFWVGRARTGHYGLVGMRERAHLIGARLEIHGRPGKGARVILRVPRADPAERGTRQPERAAG